MRKELSEQYFPTFQPMQLDHCMLIKLHVQQAKNATAVIVTNVLINLEF